MPKTRAKTGFDASLQELEKLVARMESGELNLEESLKLYARGMELSKACRAALEDAERQVDILTREGAVEPFETAPSDDDKD